METILGIIGSPRRRGNCELMVKTIGRQINRPHRLRLLRLTEFDLHPCRACYRCLFEGNCPLDDDYGLIVEALLNADACILAAPTYFLGPNSGLKRFTDRGLALYPHLETLWGKPAVAVGIAGIPGKEGYTMLGIESALRLLFAEIRSQAMVDAALPGEVFLNGANLETAARMAKALGQPAPPAVQPCCSLCGGKTFRFLDRNHVRCMLCSNTGTLKAGRHGVTVDIAPGDHELFLTREDAIAHRDWLVGMKSDFESRKTELKAVVREFGAGGDWIRPPARRRQP